MTSFYKVSGAGNDFIALVEPERPPRPGEILAWCRRGVSVGADGVITLARTESGARMVHYNADGGRSDLCLNGSRCAAQLAYHLHWQEAVLALETDAGKLEARHVDESRVGIELPPIVGTPEPLALEVDGSSYEGFRLDVGVPHFVLPWPESLSRAPVAQLGPALRGHAVLRPKGANVHFVRCVERRRFEIRSFERGVEAETLACGTGVVASAVSGVASGSLELPVTALTSGGFELTVDGDGEANRVALIGDARIVARGELLSGAQAPLTAAEWR